MAVTCALRGASFFAFAQNPRDILHCRNAHDQYALRNTYSGP